MTDTVCVVTNRPHYGAGGFGPPPLETTYSALSFGSASVSASADPAVSGTLDPVALSGSDADTSPEPSPDLVGFAKLWLTSAKAANKMPVLSVHGYDYSFADAITRTGDVAAWYAAAPQPGSFAPLLFTWPSVEGLSTQNYLDDRGRVQLSAHAFARTIVAVDMAWQELGKPAMALLAHSMGNFALDNALGLLAGTGHPISAGMFAQVLLAGADVDTNALATGGLRLLTRIAAATTLCVNLNDGALTLSRHILEKPRLGQDGPVMPQSLPAQISVVDYSMAAAVHGDPPPNVTEPDYWGHQYYRTNPRIREDMAQILRNIAPAAVQGRITAADLGQTGQSVVAGRLYVLPFWEVLQRLAQLAAPVAKPADLGGGDAPPPSMTGTSMTAAVAAPKAARKKVRT